MPQSTRQDGRQVNQMIRDEIKKAAEIEAAICAFTLRGRDSEARITLDARLAGILRGQDIPRETIHHFGFKHYYPLRVFTRAAHVLERTLGWQPLEIYPRSQTAARVDPPESETPERTGDAADWLSLDWLVRSTDTMKHMSDSGDWYNMGISFKAARLFSTVACGPQEALEWLQHGFTPPEAVEAVRNNVVRHAARSRREGVPWSRYFSRSATGPDRFAIRDNGLMVVNEVLQSLQVPQRIHASMYSYRTEALEFLDGGAFFQDGYGIDRRWIVGRDALRFVCLRLGLRQPLRRNNKSEKIADETPDQLEVRFLAERSSHNSATLARFVASLNMKW